MWELLCMLQLHWYTMAYFYSLGETRSGEICNACVLLVKRWKKLPVGSKKNWNHVSSTKFNRAVHRHTHTASCLLHRSLFNSIFSAYRSKAAFHRIPLSVNNQTAAALATPYDKVEDEETQERTENYLGTTNTCTRLYEQMW